MRILIEEYKYSVTDVKDTLYGIDALENVEGKVSVHYVGYYYNTLQRDCVFILPKVLLMDDKSKDSKKANLVFGKYRPEEILNLDEHNLVVHCDYINELSELDVSGIQPTAHAMEQTNVWREDISRPGYAREQMLANAPAIIEEELIRVPQVLPGEGMS